jgi:hypothetical protein
MLLAIGKGKAMERNNWSVTYSIVSQESAVHGDSDEIGYIWENCTLRQALDSVFETRTSQVSGVEYIEANCYPCDDSRWFSVSNGMEFVTGDCEERSLHFPESITNASRKRLMRLAGAHGVK